MTDLCRERITAVGGFHIYRCGRKTKSDGLCGIHASAKARREHGAALRQAEADAGAAKAAAISVAVGLEVGYSRFEKRYFISEAAIEQWWAEHQMAQP